MTLKKIRDFDKTADAKAFGQAVSLRAQAALDAFIPAPVATDHEGSGYAQKMARA